VIQKSNPQPVPRPGVRKVSSAETERDLPIRISVDDPADGSPEGVAPNALIIADRPPSAKTLRGWETELVFPWPTYITPRVIAYDKAKILAWIRRRAKA
jgi:hypothetical protein